MPNDASLFRPMGCGGLGFARGKIGERIAGSTAALPLGTAGIAQRDTRGADTFLIRVNAEQRRRDLPGRQAGTSLDHLLYVIDQHGRAFAAEPAKMIIKRAGCRANCTAFAMYGILHCRIADGHPQFQWRKVLNPFAKRSAAHDASLSSPAKRRHNSGL